MSRLIDLTSKRFDRLVVIKLVGRNKQRNCNWLCMCDCGKEKVVSSRYLRNGDTRSCGCLFSEGNNTKHGHANAGKISRTYQSWENMIARCENINNPAYNNYGGRGVAVCERWKKFENFLEDIGEMPDRYQIDRINNNRGYYKGNCRWATSTQQSRNKRNNHLITFMGKTQCVTDWARETGINRDTILGRLKYDWSIDKAFTTPVRKCKKRSK